jgi:homoserine kinase type II
MAVFTAVSAEVAAALVQKLNLGTFVSLRGILSGIENTNYFLATDRGTYVLTLFERLSAEELPFYLQLMKHLAARDIPVPDPQADPTRRILLEVCGRPAVVVSKLEGSHQLHPRMQHCVAVGAMLARMHLAGQDFPLSRPNPRGLSWWVESVPIVIPFLNADQQALIEAELHFQRALSETIPFEALPRGPIHADLFRDNVMFDGSRLTGFFDFYFAGCDTFLFDIAVCLNDWCIDQETGRLHDGMVTAFVTAYETIRPLCVAETRLLPALLRAAALRFWISRLRDQHIPRDANMIKPHDAAVFERILRERIASATVG